ALDLIPSSEPTSTPVPTPTPTPTPELKSSPALKPTPKKKLELDHDIGETKKTSPSENEENVKSLIKLDEPVKENERACRRSNDEKDPPGTAGKNTR
ncbi:hypothetical protein GcM3_005042, partial [Golovinomyces cichoracearum]